MPDIDQQKGGTEYGEDDGKEGEKTVHDGKLWWGKDNTFEWRMVVLPLPYRPSISSGILTG
jgi:hypothetical protein